MLAVIATAVVLVVFSLFATKAIVQKGIYQRHVLHARRDVVNTLKSNYTAAQTLVTQYNVFATQDPNMLGGKIDETDNLDGDNPKIVLDALPSSYDAPALASSVEKILLGKNVTINSIAVTDDPNLSAATSQQNPQPQPIAFSFIGTTTFASGFQLIQDFERSIRPFDVNSIEIDGSDNQLRLTVNMTTYTQPAKSLDLTPTLEVK